MLWRGESWLPPRPELSRGFRSAAWPRQRNHLPLCAAKQAQHSGRENLRQPNAMNAVGRKYCIAYSIDA